MEKIVKNLIWSKKTIATMESCTGGYVVNAITNIPGASSVLRYSAVTYSNEFKVKMGVDEKVIEEFSVYSQEVADEMSLNISKFADSNYGIGITGKLLKADPNNEFGSDNEVFVSIYNRENDEFVRSKIKVVHESREENKELVLQEIVKMLKKELKIK